MKLILSLLFIAVVICGCHDSMKSVMIDEIPPTSQGATYVSCESTPWVFTLVGLMSCEFSEPAPLSLNPKNSCPFHTIHDENGDIKITFSNDQAKGRIVVQALTNNVVIRDENQTVQTEIYLNDGSHFFIENDDATLKIDVINVYIGGCYHELIRWEG